MTFILVENAWQSVLRLVVFDVTWLDTVLAVQFARVVVGVARFQRALTIFVIRAAHDPADLVNVVIALFIARGIVIMH